MKNFLKKMLALMLILFLALSIFLSGCVAKEKPLNVVIVWNNHQPFYKDQISGTYILPWVRLHGAKDYARMPELVSKYPDVKVTFNISGSLMDQVKDYENGATDRNLQLSEKPAKSLTIDEKFEMLQIPGGFFDINWDHILKKDSMYNEILSKRQEAFTLYGSPLDKTKISNYLSNADYLNLQTLFNLLWIDSDFILNNVQLKPLYDKSMNGTNFTEDDKKMVLDTQQTIIKSIFSEYRKLLENKQIELVTTPYSHTISALLVDFGLSSELESQVQKGVSLFKEQFGSIPNGAWAPECALNDEALKIFSQNGWNWTISDTENLFQLGIDTKANPLAIYVPYNADGVTVFFRDKYLSDGIGFKYSGKSVEESLKDVEDTLLAIQKENKNGELVYTIALDGENAWENYENDGNDFLNAFYKKLSDLQNQGKIKLVTPTEYIKKFGIGTTVSDHKVQVLDLKGKDITQIKSYSNLPSKEIEGQFGESSWVDPTLETWIGETQENIAWTWLLDVLSKFNSKEASIDATAKDQIIEILFKAEGSDWFWWYGSDQSSGNDPSFDRLYKLYLANIYMLMNENIPQYLFGNYFPDGAPYDSETVSLDEGKSLNIPLLALGVSGTAEFSKNMLSISLKNAPEGTVVGLFNGKSLDPFFKEQLIPSTFDLSPFPYESKSIGIPVDFEVYPNNAGNFSIDTKKLDTSNLFIAIASSNNGNLVKISKPIKLRLPIKISGTVIGELFDDEGDDYGTGAYTYPQDTVFADKGHIFDLVSFAMIDAGNSYIMQFEMGSIGGNDWNGQNGFSFQIIEAYIDFKDGGINTSIDPNGPVVSFDLNHSWDIALRIAGWSYGNLIAFSDGTTVQGELGMQVDDSKNLITVSIPKKYIDLSTSYKPYIAIISGSQDGYGAGYFRAVNITASEWAGGGADSNAFNAGLAPKVYDIFVPQGEKQQSILSSYNVANATLAMIPYLPIEKAKPVAKLTGTINISAPKVTPPETNFSVICSIKNIGKGTQMDNEGNEFSMNVPEYVNIKSIKVSSGNAATVGKTIEWNGRITSGQTVTITLNAQLAENTPNGLNMSFEGVVNYDVSAALSNTATETIKGGFTTNYTVVIEIPFSKTYFLRSGVKIQYSKDETLKSAYVEEFKDISAPLGEIINAIGGIYEFDSNAKKVTITFMGNKFEHWIGQNKSLLNGTAIPLIPGNSDIRSYMENNMPVIPISAIVYAFKFQYSINTTDKIAYMYYVP